jgi:hypothetical protein
MRTPLEIARLLGWPEAQRRAWDWDGQPIRMPDLIVEGPRVVKLRVKKDPTTGRWEWALWEGCRSHGYGLAPTQPAALAVGLAALETASVRSEA